MPWLLGAYWLDSPFHSGEECRRCTDLHDPSLRAPAVPEPEAARVPAGDGALDWAARPIGHRVVRGVLLALSLVTVVAGCLAVLFVG